MQKIFLFIVSLLFTGCATASDDGIPPKCSRPSCALVAQEKALPKKSGNPPLRIGTGHFSLRTEGIEAVRVGRDNILITKYGKERGLAMAEIWPADFYRAFSSELLKQSSIALGDFPYIMFTKTPLDKEPEGNADKVFWRLALLMKEHIGQDTHLLMARVNGLHVFYYERSKPVNNVKAYVVDPDQKDRYLEMTAYDFSVKEFETDVIAYISSAKEK